MPERMVTEREAVIRERHAYELALYKNTALPADVRRIYAAATYPLPKIKRPRVVTDEGGMAAPTEWRYVNGELEWRMNPDGAWEIADGRDGGGKTHIRAARLRILVRILADLIANPTEEVEDGDA